jgi:hypothetical protein
MTRKLEASAIDGIPLRDSDGLITIESAKVTGMADFALVQDNHWRMRYSNVVASLVLSFLRKGRFERKIK